MFIYQKYQNIIVNIKIILVKNFITLIDDADSESCNRGTKLGEKKESTLRHPTKLLNK